MPESIIMVKVEGFFLANRRSVPSLDLMLAWHVGPGVGCVASDVSTAHPVTVPVASDIAASVGAAC